MAASLFDCANAPLDDVAMVLVDGLATTRLINATPCEDVDDPAGCQMFPNDKTDTQNNLALSSDYSVQLKDDGKPLYGWGGIHKRPNDIRMYARLELPEEWKEESADFVVTRADNRHIETMKLLLAKGADANARDGKTRTAIMRAAIQRHVEVIKVLLANGADINVSDANGRTALILAAASSKHNAVKILLKNGADSQNKTWLH